MEICGIPTAPVFYIVRQNINTFLGWEEISNIGYDKVFSLSQKPTVNATKESAYKKEMKKIQYKKTTIEEVEQTQ